MKPKRAWLCLKLKFKVWKWKSDRDDILFKKFLIVLSQYTVSILFCLKFLTL